VKNATGPDQTRTGGLHPTSASVGTAERTISVNKNEDGSLLQGCRRTWLWKSATFSPHTPRPSRRRPISFLGRSA
jgi:hypothetical protein